MSQLVFRRWLPALLITLSMIGASGAQAAGSPTLAYLGTFFQNDNEGLERTSDAEKARLGTTGEAFRRLLAESGKFRIVPTSDGIDKRVEEGQPVGHCGGCEIDYGKALGAGLVAWIRVQKVSNLILNMNVYIADVGTGRMLLTKSVDLRGNTDESWSRSLRYVVKNAVLASDIQAGPSRKTQ